MIALSQASPAHKGSSLVVLDIDSIQGLSEAGAAERLRKHGPNELPSSKPRSIWAIAGEVVREPMFLLLLAAGAIYLLVGDLQEALLLLGFVFVVMGITLYQERKTERALEALRDLSSPRALVIRAGKRLRIAGRDVVPDDVLVLSEGDRIPADGMLISSVNLAVDESMLTGESVPVRKAAAHDDTIAACTPGGDDLPFVYSGTLVVQGQGIARVTSTGLGTELGKIGKSLQSLGTEETPLQKETRRLVKILALIGVSLCILVAVVYSLSRGNWLEGFLAGIALAMAMLPEEFPVVLMIFLALGAWRISKKRVLTRRIPAVETLGSATVLAVDKTGTLTQNRMSVARLSAGESIYDLAEHAHDGFPEQFHRVIEYSILASQQNPFDPMEVAFKEFGETYLAGTEHLHPEWQLIREYPLSRELLSITRVWQEASEGELIVAAKGAPETISRLCHLDPVRHAQFVTEVQSLAGDGFRVLGVAAACHSADALPSSQEGFSFELLGLVALADPIRPTVPEAIRECNDAGIRVVMITGDYPATAQSIARQIGLTPRSEIITGRELDQLSDAELRAKIKTVNIFARVVPEQKLRIVQALKANGEVVAMTGDGVNDAPALKAAHIGVAMGGRGTDVARESASLVLLDDDFSSIVGAVRMGRRIFDNLKKAMAYIVAVHVPIAGMSVIPVLLNWPLVLLPVHIVILELIIDPACSTAFESEKEEPTVMRRPPRKRDEPIFSLRTTMIALIQGLSALAVVLIMFTWAIREGKPEADARALAFGTLVIANLALIWTNRSWTGTIVRTFQSRNIALWAVTAGALLLLGLILFVPFLNGLFKVTRLEIHQVMLCLLAGGVSVVWFELLKLFVHRRRTQGAMP